MASTAGKEPGSDRSAGAQGIQVDGILEKARSQREVRLAALRRTQRDGRALYADENGKPRLLPSFVVYLDELGTSQRIAAMNDEDLERDIQDYDDLRWFLHDQKTGWADEFQRTLYFSDNVVVAAPIRSMNWAEDLGLFPQVFAAGAYQLNMSLRGRRIRGGIASGEAYADHSFVTGPAHLEAVRLEESVALNPRIILDDTCVHLARREHDQSGYADRQNSPYGTFLLVDADGQTFVNYLAMVAEDSQEDVEPGLRLHRSELEKSLSAIANTRVLRKYGWLAEYHNFVADTFFGRSDLFVDGYGKGQFARFGSTNANGPPDTSR